MLINTGDLVSKALVQARRLVGCEPRDPSLLQEAGGSHGDSEFAVWVGVALDSVYSVDMAAGLTPGLFAGFTSGRDGRGGMTLDLINLSPRFLLHLKVTSSFVFNSGGVTLSNKNCEALTRSEMYLWAGLKVTISGMLFWMVVVFTGSIVCPSLIVLLWFGLVVRGSLGNHVGACGQSSGWCGCRSLTCCCRCVSLVQIECMESISSGERGWNDL